ncbi:chloride channel protein [Trichothermofontia sichuanensis B231]|uniref:chloride channel protein n=1 Tax=Trichothermofontia sichuanensis TaxID=3045816 RepID=UPI00224857C5|nr:chloride channel protein [Trichothermofontia sichuanensis]UZQ52892.1 chloride channel protein [Trichothermofontia sichuanensis B231]
MTPIPRWLTPLRRSLKSVLRPRRIAILEACLIGLVSGLAAVLLSQSIGWLGLWRVRASYTFSAYWVLPLFGVGGGWLAGVLVERLAPEAAGSGIPQVKMALAGLPMPLNWRVALVKLVSTVLVVGSGFSLGRQGPIVQIGASLAAQMSHWVPTSPDYRRQLIAAGAAAGLAAGFNAPIAGVLFVIEELLQDFSGLTLGTAILASFVGSVVSRVWGGGGFVLTQQAPILGRNLADTLSGTIAIRFSVQDLPFFLILGSLAGLLGALFNQGVLASRRFYQRTIPLGLPLRMAATGLVMGLLIALLPETFRNHAGLQNTLLTGDTTGFLLALAFIMKFLLTLIAAGTGAPGGLFAPSLVLGAALGSFVGVTSQAFITQLAHWGWVATDWVEHLAAPYTYALAGMGAFFGAITRGPITAIVIVFEMTMSFDIVLPLMIGSVVAYLVAELVARGSIYDRLLALNGVDLSKDSHTLNTFMSELTAADVMQKRVETLSSQLTLDEVKQAFSRSHHRGFPVVDNGKLVGIVTQSDLMQVRLGQRANRSDVPRLYEFMTPDPIGVSPHDTLSHVLHLLNTYQMSRLPVTEGRKLVGIITRGDIIRAESDQLSGKVDQRGPQPDPSYVVYQTRAPAIGQGRILVPLANPHTAPLLLQLACALARDRNYELECLQVIKIARSQATDETVVNISAARRLLQKAVRLGRSWQVPVHTQIRVAHDAAHAILETVHERHIDLILTGWKGQSTTPGRVFGSTVDTLIRQTACEVIVVKWGQDLIARMVEAAASGNTLQEASLSLAFDRWLVPLAGGPNAQRAIQLLPALTIFSEAPEIRLCQVFEPTVLPLDTQILDREAAYLERHLHGTVHTLPVQATAVADTLLALTQQYHCDVILLGASREGLLQQAFKGNIPAAIARRSRSTVILVRSAVTNTPHPAAWETPPSRPDT